MRCLVTGGAGFIGSHLVERLLGDGHTVVVLDNFSTGRLENLTRVKYTSGVAGKSASWRTRHDSPDGGVSRINPNLTIHQVNISNYRVKLIKFFQKIDWVFHLAALADIIPSIEDPIVYHKSNIDGTVNILEASRNAHVKRFIYAASSSCYGIPKTYPTSETAFIDPQYPYALTKNIGEQYVLHWGKVYKLPIVSLRLFNVYGPRSRTTGTYGAVFGVFLAQKLAGQPFTVVGDGTQSRDFTFVTDVVDAFLLAVKSTLTDKILNVGTGTPQSINSLVKLLGGDVTYIPKRPGEPDKTQADISKIKKLLNWKPQISFANGVQIMLKNIDYWKSAPLWTSKKIEKATKEWFKYL